MTSDSLDEETWRQLQATYLPIAERSATSPRDAAFLRGRLIEGRGIAEYLIQRFADRSLAILDLGTGNGGVSLTLSLDSRNRVTSVDRTLNPAWSSLRSSITAGAIRAVAAEGQALPFADETFHVVLCLETLEHVRRPRRLGAEIMRVLRPGGICMITTPARLFYLFRADPHFGVPLLLLLPDRAQRWVVTKLLRRVAPAAYDVEHTFWYAGSIARLFPGHQRLQCVDHAGPTAPAWFWQRFVWRRLVIQKAGRDPSPARYTDPP